MSTLAVVLRLIGGFSVASMLAIALIFWPSFVMACNNWICWPFIW